MTCMLTFLLIYTYRMSVMKKAYHRGTCVHE